MPAVLLRVGANRKSAWELTDARQVVDYEFYLKDGTPDLSPSFYFLPEGVDAVVQAHAEHSASWLDNPKGGLHLDASNIEGPAPIETVGATVFSYTRQAHRALRFRGVDEMTY